MIYAIDENKMKTLSEYVAAKVSGDLGLTDIAKGIGVSDSHLSRVRSGKIKSVGLNVAINMALYFREPLDEILKMNGQGEYFGKMKRCLAKEFRKDPTIQLNVPGGEFEGVKCLDSPVCLGPGFNMDEAQVVGYFPILKGELPVGYKSEPDRIVCFPTAGLSMVPTIMPDSHVVIDRYVPAEWVVPGGLYAFLLPNEGVAIKRLIKVMDNSIIIDADNPDPTARKIGSTKDFPMVLSLREDHSIIRGRVIWILNRLVPKE